MRSKGAILLLLGLVFIIVACVSVYFGLKKPLLIQTTLLDNIRANSERLSMMIIAGVSIFFSVTFFAKGIRALKEI